MNVLEENPPRLLRSWLLATLRFAVTLRSEDKLFLLGVAAELDKQGTDSVCSERCFNFFQRTSIGICQAIVSEDSLNRTSILQQHLARISEERLMLAFAAAVSVEYPFARPGMARKSKVNKLWKGLSPRYSQSAG